MNPSQLINSLLSYIFCVIKGALTVLYFNLEFKDLQVNLSLMKLSVGNLTMSQSTQIVRTEQECIHNIQVTIAWSLSSPV